MGERENLIGALGKRIGTRRVVWFGTRGLDAQPLLALEQFEKCYGLTAPLDIPGISELCLERLTGTRMDLDTYDVDTDPAPELLELRRNMLATFSESSIVVAYRPSRFLSSIEFARQATVVPAFMFQEQQAVFEHKPWVETQLRHLGIRTIPWEYIADEQHAEVLRRLHDGPLMLRPSKGSGGVGLVRVDDPRDIEASWPHQAEAFVSVAPFLDPTTPLNVAGCIGAHGEIAIHTPSIQLIGVRECTNRGFGFCGNDYGAAAVLAPPTIDEIERITRQVGLWLASMGYLGAFGVDFLLADGVPLFTEVNARFQGCSLLSAEIDRRLGLPEVQLEHIAAHLGVALPARPTMIDQVRNVRPLAHVVIHNQYSSNIARAGPASPIEWPDHLLDITSVPAEAILVAPGAALFRLVVNDTITSDGFAISPIIATTIEEIGANFVLSTGQTIDPTKE